MFGSRPWRALMWRNLIYIRRHWLSTVRYLFVSSFLCLATQYTMLTNFLSRIFIICLACSLTIAQIFEVVLPLCFVLILVALKNAPSLNKGEDVVPEFLPDDNTTLIPFSYRDYVIALQAKRVCVLRRDGDLEISGIFDKGVNWQVPFIKCDSRMCMYPGQNAQPFCEYSILVASGAHKDDTGGQERAAQFKDWMLDRYPVLAQDSYSENQTSGLPFEFEFVQLFSDPSAMDAYVQQQNYGSYNVPKMSMGVVFDGNSTNSYGYSLRQNSTNVNTPQQLDGSQLSFRTTAPTDRLFNNHARTDFETCVRERGSPQVGFYQKSCTGLYLYNGVIATQRLVGDFILEKSGAAEAGYSVAEAGVQYVQFPQRQFSPSGFFDTIKGTCWFDIDSLRCRHV